MASMPTAGIIDPFELVVHCMENACDNGVRLFLNEKVTTIREVADHYEVTTTLSVHRGHIVINATGVNADLVAEMIGPNQFSIKPRKGSYFVLDHFDNHF
jgi:glycerol-3-phosphate dehydrogenase